MVKSGGGVLFISAGQLVIGLCLLGIYEGYKRWYFAKYVDDVKGTSGDARTSLYESPLDWRSPMGFLYPLSILNNIFAVCGLFGVLNAQRELIIAFFGWNAAQMVVAFHTFVDMCTDTGVRYAGEPPKLTSFERAAAAFVFFNFLLSVAATLFAVRAIEEMKAKQREEYGRIAVLSDNLQFEPDV